jgi:hypothetical protein
VRFSGPRGLVGDNTTTKDERRSRFCKSVVDTTTTVMRQKLLYPTALALAVVFGTACQRAAEPLAQPAPAAITPIRMVAHTASAARASRPAVETLGTHIGVVFSPDFSVPTNREFYERLGFAYFEDASWERVFEAVRRHNEQYPDRAVETLVVNSHGTNGNGLKLQASKRRKAPRSYASVAALQERLEPAGVKRVVLAACNSGRLFRPDVYKRLNANTRDPLFLPPTLGIVNASSHFDPAKSPVRVLRRSDSYRENTTEGYADEIPPQARAALGLDDPAEVKSLRFVVSDLFMQMLLDDPNLTLTDAGFHRKISRKGLTDNHSEEIYYRFMDYLGTLSRPVQASVD